MKDKCIIKTADKPCGNCMIRITPAVHKRLLDLSLKTCRSITSIASELMDFALDRVEVEYQYDDPSGGDQADLDGGRT